MIGSRVRFRAWNLRTLTAPLILASVRPSMGSPRPLDHQRHRGRCCVRHPPSLSYAAASIIGHPREGKQESARAPPPC